LKAILESNHPITGYVRVIRPRRGWHKVDWSRLLQYRDLLWILVRRDFVARYQQTVLGPLWFILQPLIATAAFTLIFGRGLRTSTDGLPPFLFYQCGMLVWGFFATIFGTSGNTFQANASVFTKVYFPRLIVPLAVMIGSLAPFAIQLGVFLLVYAPAWWSAREWSPDPLFLALLPLGLLQTGAFAFAISLLTSGLSAKYRDLQHTLPFLLQVWLFVTPVIYPLSELRGAARWIAALNPLTPVVESFRLAFFGVGTISVPLVALSVSVTVLVCFAGLFCFQRAERTFADTI
jgi:lipopolysaccharide transport system permease protein